VDVPLPHGVRSNGRTSLVIGVRPESLEVAPDGIPAKVDVVEDIGADAFVFCSTELEGKTTKLVARSESRKAPKQGDRVTLRPRADEAHLFDPASGERLEH
jgi:multiple sugar transport system ATP-binding protein